MQKIKTKAAGGEPAANANNFNHSNYKQSSGGKLCHISEFLCFLFEKLAISVCIKQDGLNHE